jgi:adenine-specific DNA-methyltransferase
MNRLARADRFIVQGSTLRYKRLFDDFPYREYDNIWSDTAARGFFDQKTYVVQTGSQIIQRCILMTTDPGDLVLDPTCGSGTTAYVAEQWGRRWITIDTSRVALALARARIMGARYPFYLLADSRAGQIKEGEITRTIPSEQPTHGHLRHGFVYERVPRVIMKSIANNVEIDVIWDKWHTKLEPLRDSLNATLKKSWQEWEIPREAGDLWSEADQEIFFNLKAEIAKGKEGNPVTIRETLAALNHNLNRNYTVKTLPDRPVDPWPDKSTQLHAAWWEARIARQKEIDASIAAKAEFEFLYDKPYDDKSKVRVAGPFTVETISPHRVLTVNENDDVVDGWKMSEEKGKSGFAGTPDFAAVILENLKLAGVQQAHKEDRLTFTSLVGWPGEYICAEGRYFESPSPAASSPSPPRSGGEGRGEVALRAQGAKTKSAPDDANLGAQRRAAIFIGPEFGTVSRPDLVAAAREAADANFDVLIACAFNYDAHSAEFEKLGRIPVLKARMNPDLHMADELKNTGAGNLFVVFGEPDIEVAAGLWLVARGGRLVACYEHTKELSGLGSLEEINRLGGTDLPGLKKLSAGRAVRPDQSVAPGSGVGAIEHRGGSGKERDGGVSPGVERGQRVAGGGGDAGDHREPAGNAAHSRDGDAAGAGGRNQQNVGWSQALAGIETLKPADFPLSLTTSHYAQITVRGVDVFKPQTGEVVSAGPEGIACWFIDTDYNEESFFVRHAYFLGQNDPYQALKTSLRAEIDQEAWESLHSAISRPFPKPTTGRIAVKVINHLGDEVMKVFGV